MAKRQITKDLIFNTFLKLRYYFMRKMGLISSNKSDTIKDGYELTFNENFSHISWDNGKDKKWHVGEHWGDVHPDKPIVYYGPPELRNGRVFFTSKVNPKEFTIKGEKVVVPYQVSLLSSYYSFAQKYGRFECRCNLPDAPGSFPAFWMWGETGEIDIFEFYGGENGKSITDQKITLHSNDIHSKSATLKVCDYKDIKEMREYALEWREKQLDFFVDGILIKRLTDPMFLKKFKTKQWIVINNSVDKSAHGNMYYSEFEVDYIRGYKIID